MLVRFLKVVQMKFMVYKVRIFREMTSEAPYVLFRLIINRFA